MLLFAKTLLLVFLLQLLKQLTRITASIQLQCKITNSTTHVQLQKECAVGTHARSDSGIGTRTLCGNFFGNNRWKFIKTNNRRRSSQDLTPVHVTIPKARAAGTTRLIATAMQRGGDMDRPMCSRSPMKTMIQAHYGESSSVQDDESDSHTYPSLLIQISLISCKHHGLSDLG